VFSPVNRAEDPTPQAKDRTSATGVGSLPAGYNSIPASRPICRFLNPRPGGAQRMIPKPFNDAVHKGFAYLIRQQSPEGGWSQGGGWRTNSDGGRIEGPNVADPPDVANTCVAALALLRGENTPRQGEYAANVARALDFVIGSVERADAESPYITELRGTQVQTKIGPYADTFLASLTLAEAKGRMPDQASEVRRSAALDKVIRKMERHQQADGTWAMHGWAPVVGQGLAAAGLNRARQSGANVSDEVLQRSEKHARSKYDARHKRYSLEGSAGGAPFGTARPPSPPPPTPRREPTAPATPPRV